MKGNSHANALCYSAVGVRAGIRREPGESAGGKHPWANERSPSAVDHGRTAERECEGSSHPVIRRILNVSLGEPDSPPSGWVVNFCARLQRM